MNYDDTYEENEIITISLGTSVKTKITNKFGNDLEDFIEKEFPQDKELNTYFFKYKRGDEDKLALKIDGSEYMLLMERSKDRETNLNDNYMFCFDIQNRKEFTIDDNNEFIKKQCELKIPVEFNRRYYNNSSVVLLDDIEKQFSYIAPYEIPSLAENEEFKKWYAYLTLLEKLIDEKDFYFEVDILYTEKKAKIDISHIEDKELLENIKKARNQTFLFYEASEIDTGKPLHTWDEKDNRHRNFGELKQNKNSELTFDLDDNFIKKYKKLDNDSEDVKEIISNNYDTNDFIVKARQFLEKSIKKIDNKAVYKDVKNTKLNTTNSIKNLKISKKEELELIDTWNILSEKNHNADAHEIDKKYINEVLKILRELLPNKNNIKIFNPPSKLILRVSYFRDQFQLKTLKRGLEQIQRHPLKAYLFGDKKIEKIDDEALSALEIEYLSKVLNDRQKESIKKALISESLFMIQGPPGTGKTEVISEIAYQEAIRGKKVLITSQANMAVDNALQRLKHPSLYPIRIIRKDYEPEDGNSLPIKENISDFYQNRIISHLSSELEVQSNELTVLKSFINSFVINEELIECIEKLQINIPSNIDLTDTNDKEDFVRILRNSKNLEYINERISLLEELLHYSNIQNDFLEEFKSDNNQDIDEEKAYLSSSYLKNANIWGATLFETGKYSFKDLSFDVVIVDEVSKAMPPELVLPILKAKKLILVGDHKQLPPIVKDVSLEDLANETGISLDSLDFETTVFEKLINNNPHAFVMLNTQYRMHPDIQKAINQFYLDENGNGGLECGLINPDLEKCHQLQFDTFKSKHLVWYKTKESAREEKPQGGTSFINRSEIDSVRNILKYLDNEYKKINKIPSVGVITFYGKQLGELTKLEKRGFWKLPQEEREFSNINLRFGTVDRFQGQEKDIIIVSLVRNNKNKNVGFAKKPNRVNVAFSRAKKLLIIIGNVDNFTFTQDEKTSKMYRNIFNIAKKFGSVKVI